MKLKIYKEIESDIIKMPMKKEKCLNYLQDKYNTVSKDTLISIYAQLNQRKIKKNFKKHHRRDSVARYYQQYCTASKSSECEGFLCRQADAVDFPPTLFARIILEEYAKRNDFLEMGIVPKGYVSKWIKDPSQIEDKTLSQELKLCIQNDDFCGPIIENIKRETGLKYEKILHDILTAKGIPYYDEEILRKEGYDKTPDFKLVVPIVLNNYVVNWIESKASFGDEESHAGYLQNQFWSYTNRFGPGLVIYWFGFIDELNINMERGILLDDKFPQDILRLETLLDDHEKSFCLTF
ncbi:CDAN1-interacting nuclease 1-like isoform X1 [Hydractinia symbiolongicarpus]|uniref:CDAN1-interacting nuclease 1-like isoform X1 n=1 Tax=Hydractinia symbiolongicarpus TaxID=13093 RepID=UPI00254B5EDD|nr:CDAN1-interacting nuclease 1-like isoform X1 [Hydractinia symbiolongicarpus]XP_057317249.1 CDAN1-interacting nuclease 1-like isoform X1 [Hydractinia symbiolongicarpus]